MLTISPSRGRPVTEATVPADDYRVARKYLRHYQRGFFLLLLLAALPLAAAPAFPTTLEDLRPAGYLSVLLIAAIYALVPYRRKAVSLCRRVADGLDLLPDRR